ncbi:TPA: glycosyl transferase [Vibrio parahaemolyticus]|uniref:GH36-type glycosyl hydrolase domain-containing protein n=1 Tax=unclassified Vibrio TaxID=2614977 RepID=UPI001B8333C6|nr:MULTISPECIES: glycosyl transferase [unclassified Vibrio]EJE4203748.1 glycosyl transferase [Vibrio parahaemolyticus]MCR9981277.1 glycosyl transferase [Vibrio alginolyticus]MEA3484295.1 glycosyl transferase [Pseudomonadota bacterium]ELB2779263.1 glycosyl transferase [Vibrio parahaemolyticus]MDU9595537.1 glycosyl transferase [Vibrio sp. 2-1-2a]
MKFGYFDDNNKEYITTTPCTPIKWCNYVGTLEFGGLVDSNGGVVLCKGDPALNRITKYIAQLPNSDFKGSTVYLKVTNREGNVEVFSPFYTPTLKPLEKFENHTGLSYTTIIAEGYGVRCEATLFVPKDAPVLLEDIKITNISDEALHVDVVPVFEFTHFDALKQLVNADWVPQTMTLKAHQQASGHTVLEQYAFMKRDYAVNLMTADRPATSFDGDRQKFLGNLGYGSWAAPEKLFTDELGNSECLRGDNIGALNLRLGWIEPKQMERTVVQLTQMPSLEQAEPMLEKYRDHQEVDKALDALANHWDNYLAAVQVETPDPAMNSMLNIHNPRQCHTTKNWSRYLSLYQLGYGARGVGFRDSSQDTLGVITHMPEEAREFIERLLSVQNIDGSAMHQFFPSTMEANAGDSREEEDRPDYYGDDHLWIVYAVTQYVKETGHAEFLNKVIPFYQKDAQGQPVESASVWEHLGRSIEFTRRNTGQHGLPLLGFADWNDTVNLPTGAESLMVASMYGKALLDMLDLCRLRGENDLAERYQAQYEQMKAVVNGCGWDGNWFIRYFDEQGYPVGSHINEQGQIYTNGQSWPVIAGFAEKERATQALDSVYTKLNTANGIKLSTPGYNGFNPNLGGVSTYPPGAKENGGIFLHSNPWVMIAEAKMGNGDRAYEYYRQINPASKNDAIDIFESEPYCYPQNILGDEHPQFGLGRNAWLSGTSSWTYVAGTQWILGVRPDVDGLIVDPCIPSEWEEFRVKRQFRGAMYNIHVTNPNKVSKGVAELRVNGEILAGNKVPVLPEGEHQVEVRLG